MTEKSQNSKKSESTEAIKPKASASLKKSATQSKSTQTATTVRQTAEKAGEKTKQAASKAGETAKQAVNKASQGLESAEKRLRDEADSSLNTLSLIDDKKLIIIFYASILIGAFAFIPAVLFLLGSFIIANVKRKTAPIWAKSHYDFQIRTFWMFMVILAVILLLSISLVSVFLAIPVAVLAILWLMARNVVGLLLVLDKKAYPNPKALII